MRSVLLTLLLLATTCTCSAEWVQVSTDNGDKMLYDTDTVRYVSHENTVDKDVLFTVSRIDFGSKSKLALGLKDKKFKGSDYVVMQLLINPNLNKGFIEHMDYKDKSGKIIYAENSQYAFSYSEDGMMYKLGKSLTEFTLLNDEYLSNKEKHKI